MGWTKALRGLLAGFQPYYPIDAFEVLNKGLNDRDSLSQGCCS